MPESSVVSSSISMDWESDYKEVELDEYDRPEDLRSVPVTAILALAAVTRTGDPLPAVAEGSATALVQLGYVNDKRRLTSKGVAASESARRWATLNPRAEEEIAALQSRTDLLLQEIAAGSTTVH